MELEADQMIRIQVKTISGSGSVPFTGPTKAYVDRDFISGVESHVQSIETSVLKVGVRSMRANGDTDTGFFVIPTLYFELLDQKTWSVNKIPQVETIGNYQ